MRQELLKDILVVFTVWFVVAYLASGFPPSFIPNVLFGVLLIWIVGTAGGVTLTLAAREWIGSKAQRAIEGAVVANPDVTATIMDGDAERTLYNVPLPFAEPPKQAKTKTNPAHELPWWPAYAKAHPAYAAIIDAAYGVMEARPGLPAGVDRHVGVSLVEHSMDVMASILALAPGWKFDGVRNRKDAIITPLQDTSGAPHTFGDGTALSHPILPVAAFTHDIGKVTCLVMEGDVPVQMLPGHGEKGTALLRTMPTVMALPMEERDALLLSVKYYHHLFDMPLAQWIGDRTRSLTALLYAADCASGYNKAREAAQGQEATEPATAGTDNTDSTASTAPAPLPPAVAEVEAGPLDAPPPETPAVAGYTTENGGTPLDVFTDVVEARGAINGADVSRRLGVKYGPWVFIRLESFVGAAALVACDSTLLANKGHADTTPFMQTLLQQLASKGWLYAGTPARPPEKAVWRVAPADNIAGDNASVYRAIVVHIDASLRLTATADWPVAQKILDPDAGWTNPKPGLDDLDALLGDFMTKNAGDASTKDCAKVAASTMELTHGVLLAMAQGEDNVYGRNVKETSNGRFASFDAALLSQVFAFDVNKLPEGVRHTPGKNLLWVRLP